jgi:hypothetical protein
MYRSAIAIEFWLSQTDNDGASNAPLSQSSKGQSSQHENGHSKRRRSAEMTPPPSLQGHVMPPKKRKLDEDINHDDVPLLDDPDATPRSSRSSRPTGFNLSKAIPLHVPVPSSIVASSSKSGASVSSGKTTSWTRRSSSPVKNTDGLQYLDKPVTYKHLNDDVWQLPADAVTLWDAVYDVVANNTCIYPPEIRSDITSLLRLPPLENHFGPATAEGDGSRKAFGEDAGRDASLNSTIAMQEEFPDQLPAPWAFARASARPSVTRQRLARAELFVVQDIIRKARRCLDGKYCEAAWNSKVHEPLLELALFRHDPHVEYVNATSAKILPAFVPSFSTGNTIVEGKMIDFVLTRQLDYENPVHADAELAASIRAKLERQPGSRPLTVNQTDYTPLTRAPVAVAIETKVLGASLEEGRVQLAVWTAAWHRRMEALGIGGRGQAPLPTLPLLLTMDHDWTLFFACDRGTTIVCCSLSLQRPLLNSSPITPHPLFEAINH